MAKVIPWWVEEANSGKMQDLIYDKSVWDQFSLPTFNANFYELLEKNFSGAEREGFLEEEADQSNERIYFTAEDEI